ncbi:MAG: hypothetical protein ATN35_03285 [Epulopiscium sp. Nele67-Bin004]|nr:MAG: hypothetical protein ATN35_03285 [Epulopiscium sp. Nele67-Bin004]
MPNDNRAIEILFKIAIVLSISLTGLISLSIHQRNEAVQREINAKYEVIAEQNAAIVQTIVNESFTVALNLSDYLMETCYAESQTEELQNKSIIYDEPISIEGYLAENYIIHTALSAIVSPHIPITEVGIYFEPYAFSLMETYAFTITEPENEQPIYTVMSTYDEYKYEYFYYRTIQDNQTSTFLTASGKTCITTPIICYKGELVGVISICVENNAFEAIRSNDEAKAYVLSDSLLSFYGGDELTSFTQDLSTQSVQLLKEQMENEEAFFVTISTEDESYGCHMCPIFIFDEIWWSCVVSEL